MGTFEVCIDCLFLLLVGFIGVTHTGTTLERDELDQLVDFELMQMHYAFDKKQLSSMTLSCMHQATERIMTDYPSAEFRWKHNSKDFVLQPARMTYNLDSLTINSLVPEDSGVYHCEMLLSADDKITVAIYSVVISNTTQRVAKKSNLKLDCNSAKFGKIFAQSKRYWKDPKGLQMFQKKASDSIETIPSAEEKHAGTWTCFVKDNDLDRLWTTKRVFIVLDPEGPGNLASMAKSGGGSTAAIVIGCIIGFCVLIACVSKLTGKKEEGMDEDTKKMLAAFSNETEGDTTQDTAANDTTLETTRER